jgi:phosphoribosylaminoimidazole-succinocarboxamide synthase
MLAARPPEWEANMIDLRGLALTPENILIDGTIPELPNHYRGKVRDNYDLPDGLRILLASDRVSAFDRNLAAIPFKGQVLTEIARFWFEATRDICPNHVVDYPDPNVVVGRGLDMLPIEMVVREYLAGTTSTSILSMYRSGERRLYGITFPDGMRANQKLDHPIITPTTKAAQSGHDEPLAPRDIVAQRLLSAAQWEEVSRFALALFARGRDIARRRGLILVDTKYEFGFDRNGRIVLADEIHTPDSSRYWVADSYPRLFAAGERPESLDKDHIRNWVAARCDPYRDPVPDIPHEVVLDAAGIYIKAFETITGHDFVLPDLEVPILDRIRANLAKYFVHA